MPLKFLETSFFTDFIEEETARVFQLYMKTQAERKFYHQLDANQFQDSFHNTESSKEQILGWSCGIREEMVAEDKRLYEQWRGKIPTELFIYLKS